MRLAVSLSKMGYDLRDWESKSYAIADSGSDGLSLITRFTMRLTVLSSYMESQEVSMVEKSVTCQASYFACPLACSHTYLVLGQIVLNVERNSIVVHGGLLRSGAGPVGC